MTAGPRRRPSKRFRARGKRLWEAHRDQVAGERGLVLLEEACRIADRLDQLDRLLKGDADVWARLVHDVRTEDYELRIDSALVEARQQANVLRQIIASLPLKEADRGAGDDEDWTSGLQPEVRHAPQPRPPDAGAGDSGGRQAAR